MKKVLFIMFALMTTTWASAQTEDQLALKRLVDTFSNLADVKDVKAQMDLFTDDAEVHSKAGEHVSVMKGKEQIGKAFARKVITTIVSSISVVTATIWGSYSTWLLSSTMRQA